MKRIYQSIKYKVSVLRYLLLFQIVFTTGVLMAFNGGVYTINPGLAASSVNYLSVTAFVNDLRNITRGDGGPANYNVGGAGVQGAITVNIASGTGPYNQQISIPAILGMSATRTVTINGNGATLSFTPTSTAAGGVLDLNGADFFTFNNLTIVNNATFGYCVWMRNAADFNAFRNCSFRCPSMTGSTTGTAYIWISNGTTSPFSYNNAGNNNIFESNNLRTANSNGPYYGIVMVGPTTSSLNNANSGNRFISNNIQNWRYCGFYISYCSNTEFTGNTVHNTDYTVTSLKYGIYLNYATGVFERNRLYNIDGSGVTGNTQYPVYYYNFNNTTRSSTFINNSIHCRTTGFNYNYIYNYATLLGAGLSIVNNTFAHVSGTTVNNNSTTYVVYGGYWSEFRNNVMSCDFQGTGTKYLYYDFSGSSPAAFTHNNFDLRSSGNSYVGYVSGSMRPTMTDMFQAGFNTTNISTDPLYINENAASDLHPTSLPMCNKGVRITGVNSDQRGISRNSQTPDLGAIEYTIDLKMENLYLPLPQNVCAGYSSTLRGTIRNNSAFPLTGVQLASRLNLGAKAIVKLNSVINPGDTMLVTFPDAYVFSKAGSNVLRLFSDFSDDVPQNDSQSVVFNVTPSPGGGQLSFVSSSQGIFDYLNRGYSVNPYDEPFVMEMTAPRKYEMADYGSLWTNQIWAASEAGTVLQNNTIIYDHNNNGRITFVAPSSMLDSTVILYIKVSDLMTGCDTLFKRKLVVGPKGSPKFVLPSILCDGSEIYFENVSTVSSGQLVFQWDFGDGSPLDDANNPVHQFPAFGTYTVKMRSITAPYGFIKDTVFNVNINEVPNVKFKVSNACLGSPVRFINLTSIGNGIIQYEWNMGDGRGSSTATQPSYLYTSAGGYRVELKATSNGCVSTYQRNAYALPRPVASFSVGKNEYCENEEVEFVNASSLSSGTLGSIWNFSEANSISTAKNPVYDFRSSGTKQVQLKAVSEFGCSDSSTRTLFIKAAPIADFRSDFSCNLTPGRLLNASNIPAGEMPSYTWNLSDGIGNVTDVSPLVRWRSSGMRMVGLQVRLANGCADQITRAITVAEEPIASFVAEDKCANENVVFVNQSKWSQGNIMYKWEFGDGFSSNLANPVHAYTNTGTSSYTVSLIASIAGGCSDTFVKLVTINPLPTSCDFEIKRNYINGLKSFDFVPQPSNQKITYTWLLGDGNKVISDDTGVSYVYSHFKKYCVTMIAANETGCECKQTKCVTINTDIDDKEALNSKLSVYPNPSTGVFNISNTSELSIEQIQLFDVHGKSLRVIHDNFNTVDLTTYAEGIYMLELTVDGTKFVKRVSVIK
ncbi:MAG: PKD domain-containing protein [Chitinophagaceae bacterium]